jgi:hypothetical protein
MRSPPLRLRPLFFSRWPIINPQHNIANSYRACKIPNGNRHRGPEPTHHHLKMRAGLPGDFAARQGRGCRRTLKTSASLRVLGGNIVVSGLLDGDSIDSVVVREAVECSSRARSSQGPFGACESTQMGPRRDEIYYRMRDMRIVGATRLTDSCARPG